MNIHVLRVAVNLYNSPAAASLCLVGTLSVCAASAHLCSPTFVVSGCASGARVLMEDRNRESDS